MTILAGVLVAGFVLSGGLALAQNQDPDEVLTLRQRVAEYWAAARIKRDYRRQWDCWRVHCEEYKSGKGAIQYLGYEVGDARIEGSFATVQVKVTARITLPNGRKVVRTATVPDAWVKVEGVWHRRADQPDSSTTPPGTVPPSGWVW